MKYGKLINNILDIREVEKGMEIRSSITEQQLKDQGYKPVCEVKEPEGNTMLASCKNGECLTNLYRKVIYGLRIVVLIQHSMIL